METIRLLHQTIWTSPLMLILFLASVGYIIYRIKKGEESKAMLFLVIYSVAGLILVTYNPILPRFFNRFADDEYSYLRFAWIIPIYFMMGYAAMRAVFAQKTKVRQAIAVLLAVVLIVAAGEPRPGVYTKAESAYKIDDEIIEVCNVIMADRGITDPMDRSQSFRVLVQTKDNSIYDDGSRDNHLYFGIRQYAACMELAMGRVDDVIRNVDYLSFENSGIRNGYAYFIADNTPAILEAAQNVGYDLLYETEHYIVMKSHADVTLWIIRHARTEANEAGILSGSESDYPLTKEGVDQAIETGKALWGLDLDSVHTSEMGRTQKTASLVLAGMGASGITEDEAVSYGNDIPIDERISAEYNLGDISWGEASGMTLDTALSTYGISDSRLVFGAVEDEEYVSPIPGVENRARLYDRLNTAMTDYVTVEAYEATTGKKVGSGDEEEALPAGALSKNVMVVGHSTLTDWIGRVMPEAAGEELPNVSVTVVRFSDGDWTLLLPPTNDPGKIKEAVERYGKP